ncbi:hypothetical protein [Sulfurimonas sp.]|uniref:hypothetical protein n=1 Tax=Sulfurimonas sp. TaxID=2022749 RepID=UPI003D1339AB
MKSFNLLSKIFISLLLLSSFAISLFSAILDSDTFNSNTDGWTITNGDWDSGNQRIWIDRDDTATKTFSLGASYADAIVSVTLDATKTNTWESADLIQITANGSSVYNSNTAGSIAFNATLNGSGQLTLVIMPNTNNSNEDLYIDNVIISDTPLVAGGNVRTFTKRLINGIEDTNIYGNLLMIGNQLLCKNDFNGDTCEEPSATATNNSITQYFADVDSDGTTSNSSMMRLDLLPGDTIKWARLYWSARLINPSIATKAAAQTIKFRTPASTNYTNISAEVFDNFPSDNPFDYGASADVTALVQAGGAGQYFGADIQAATGTNQFASWMLFVVVENPSRPFNNISVYDGFQVVFDADAAYPDSVTATASGFITPKSGSVESNLFLYSGESESGIYDGATITNSSGVPTSLLDAKNQANDLMNGSFSVNNVYRSSYRISDPTLANPNFQNLIGTDIDKLMVSNLDNQQISTDITISSTGGDDSDRYSLNAFALETELYVPQFCYDYAYKQQGQFFTEDNDGSQNPRIVGNVIPNEPIEAKFFIRNLVDSDVVVNNMFVGVYDINTSQATYIANSTKLAKIGQISPTTLVDGTDVTVGSDYINDIEIGAIDSQEHFYVYYGLNPSTSNLDIPMTVRVNYDITLAGVTIPYELILGAQIPMCTDSGNAYNPNMETIFNVVHSDYYDYDLVGGTNRYYNLPTQVTKREGNFKVIAMDPANPDILKPQSTSVAVELIDASAFHDTYASCNEIESSISERVQVFFDNNVTSVPFDKDAIQTAINNAVTNLTDSSNFYATARENVAFRVSYGLTNDGNDSLVQHEYNPATEEYKILNFTELVQDIGTCVQPVIYNLDPVQTATQVATACGNSGTFISRKHYYACLECLFGKNTRFECSRDNFALRPEAFMIKIDDQNQTNPASQVRVADDVSGVVTPSTATNHLASGYNYQLEVDAVNHKDNTPSFGYTKSFGGLASDALEYAWSPSVAVSGCNDENNISHSFRILNGSADLNSSLNQVGEYVLQMKDTTWTRVDGNFSYMSHHVGPYYTATRDCVLDSDITQAVDYEAGSAAPFTGCNITSDHDSSNVSALKYRNYNLEFHPYKFEMGGIVASYGLNNGSNPFIYMSDIINQDENMSFHLTGPIGAVGYDGLALSNFVDNCYAKDVNLTINKSAISGAVDYLYRFHNTDLPANDQNGTMNNPASTLTLGVNDFNQSNNGSVNTVLNLNFDREVNASVNPERLTFSTYDSNCSNPTVDCTFKADLTTKTTQGVRNLDLNVTHLYGRTHASKQRYNCPGGGACNNNPANIYFESFCFGTVGGNACNKSFLPNGLASRRVDDTRWFWNQNHDITNDGNVTIVLQRGGTNGTDIVTATDNPVGNPSITTLNYNGTKGYPYKTTMENGASPWLIYNESDPTATRNEFQVEFESGALWSGEHDTNTTTKRDQAIRTNRRIMW